MGWIVKTSSGKFQPKYRLDGKIKNGPSHQYRYEAEAWLDENEPTTKRQKLTADTTQGVADFIASLDPSRPQVVADDGLTLGEYGADWLRRRNGIRKETLRFYRTQVVHGILGDPIGKVRLAELTTDDIEHWLVRMSEAGVAARNARLKVMRMVCVAAVRNPKVALTADPTAGIKRQKADLRPRAFMTEDDIVALLDVAGDDADFALLIMLGADAGLRWEEMTGLAASSVITRGSKMTIRVWQSADRDGQVNDTTKNGTERLVPVKSGRLRQALSLACKKARLRGGPDALIVIEDDRPLRYEFWTRTKLKPAYAAAGIWPLPIAWHDLRHTYGSKLAEGNTPTKMIAYLMGHSDQRVTELYMHNSTTAAIEAELDRVFGQAG